MTQITVEKAWTPEGIAEARAWASKFFLGGGSYEGCVARDEVKTEGEIGRATEFITFRNQDGELVCVGTVNVLPSDATHRTKPQGSKMPHLHFVAFSVEKSISVPEFREFLSHMAAAVLIPNGGTCGLITPNEYTQSYLNLWGSITCRRNVTAEPFTPGYDLITAEYVHDDDARKRQEELTAIIDAYPPERFTPGRVL